MKSTNPHFTLSYSGKLLSQNVNNIIKANFCQSIHINKNLNKVIATNIIVNVSKKNVSAVAQVS